MSVEEMGIGIGIGIGRDSKLAGQALAALLAANARYWSSVTPIVRRELRHWERRAEAIADPQRRELALAKLRHEAFNAEAAAVAATLAPRPHRAPAVRAIVALEVLYDYLDGLTERPHEDPLGEGERLYAAFASAVDPHAELPGGEGGALADDDYLRELAAATQSSLADLPANEAVVEVARRCARRAAQAQTRMHAAPLLGTGQLADWARSHAGPSALAWREYLAGAASSVLALHALIAAAADPRTTAAQAERLEAAYLPIAAIVTLLDGLIDHAHDTRAEALSYAALYEDPSALARALSRTARQASAQAKELPASAHHLMTLAGAIAYWASAPGASNELARPLLADLRGELRMLVVPPMLVMRAWRAGKWARRRLRRVGVLMGVSAALLAGAAAAASARSVGVRDEGRLRFVGAQARALIDEGAVSGTLPGRARVRFAYDGSPTVNAGFTIRLAGGSISGSARCRLSSPSSRTPSFRGALRITGGSGRYARARGGGELFGVFYRHGYSLVFQAIGRLSY